MNIFTYSYRKDNLNLLIDLSTGHILAFL